MTRPGIRTVLALLCIFISLETVIFPDSPAEGGVALLSSEYQRLPSKRPLVLINYESLELDALRGHIEREFPRALFLKVDDVKLLPHLILPEAFLDKNNVLFVVDQRSSKKFVLSDVNSAEFYQRGSGLREYKRSQDTLELTGVSLDAYINDSVVFDTNYELLEILATDFAFSYTLLVVIAYAPWQRASVAAVAHLTQLALNLHRQVPRAVGVAKLDLSLNDPLTAPAAGSVPFMYILDREAREIRAFEASKYANDLLFYAEIVKALERRGIVVLPQRGAQ